MDSVVLERNLGEYDHARLQGEILACFRARRKEWGIRVVPEQRVQVSSTRLRVPDACMVLGCTVGAISEVRELRTEDPEIAVPLDALFDGD